MKKRVCGNCGGHVYLQVERSTIEHPARDERGRFIYELAVDKETGQVYEKQVMVSWPIRGLGTWHCINGCKDREVKVTRFVGAGKEEELEARGKDFVVRDEYMKQVPVTRHIPVRAA